MYNSEQLIIGGFFLFGLVLIISFIRSPLKTILITVAIIVGINIVMAVIVGIASFLTYILEFLFK
ncbi:hypothetical protein ACEE94_10635 [Staphylococcus epidermidis]